MAAGINFDGTKLSWPPIRGDMENALLIISVISGYSTIGALVAAAFLTVGIERVEPGSRGSYAFRTLLIPGVCVLWPLVLWRWWVLEYAGEGS